MHLRNALLGVLARRTVAFTHFPNKILRVRLAAPKRSSEALGWTPESCLATLESCSDVLRVCFEAGNRCTASVIGLAGATETVENRFTSSANAQWVLPRCGDHPRRPCAQQSP